MSASYVVALDQGTSSCRAFAVGLDGTVNAQKSIAFPPHRPQKGFSQYDAQSLLHTQLEVLHTLLDEVGPAHVAGIGVCSQRSTVVLWDAQTGRAVAPVLTWEDGRASAESARVTLSQAQIHAMTGLFNVPHFSAPKIAWCLHNCPAAAQVAQQGTLRVAPVASYLIWQLTQGAVFATDPTLAQRTLLYNMQTGQWDETLCQAFGVPVHCLPVIKPSAADYGAYLYKGVKIPILACVADQQAAAFYQGLSAGQTAVNYGTGAFVLHHTGAQLTVLPGMLSSVAATTKPGEQPFLLEGPVFAAGSVLQWLQAAKGLSFDVSRVDALCARAQHPVQLLPALGGLGAPYWDYHATPVADQVSAQTTTADWVAGALRAVAGLVADIVYYLRAQGHTGNGPVYASGGLSQSRYLLQHQADLLQTPLVLRSQTESTVLGTAALVLAGQHKQMPALPVASVNQVSPQGTPQLYKAWQAFVQNCRKKPS